MNEEENELLAGSAARRQKFWIIPFYIPGSCRSARSYGMIYLLVRFFVFKVDFLRAVEAMGRFAYTNK